MMAVLLCAGFATRLHPITRDFPKPLLEVAGRPLVEDLVEQLLATGRVEELVVVSNARFFERFRAWRDELAARHPEVDSEVIDDGALSNDERLGAVRDLALALEGRRLSEAVIVAAGDNLFRFPLGEFLDDHAARPRNLILVHHETDPERLRRTGVSELAPDGRVLRFIEKPARPPSPFSCPPLYILEPEALARLPEFLRETTDADAPGTWISWLVQREPVFAHEMRGKRLDVGDVDSYRRAEEWLAEVEREAGMVSREEFHEPDEASGREQG
jgi:glucose-1-phosphate thymidylyltransferase